MNESAVRTLFGVGSSGAITMNQGLGKSNRTALSYVFSTNTPSPTINLSALPGYVSGASDITVTVNSGIYVWNGLNFTGGATGDTVLLVNNGFIMGSGGNGGSGVIIVRYLRTAVA
jgi:hypothetical protein